MRCSHCLSLTDKTKLGLCIECYRNAALRRKVKNKAAVGKEKIKLTKFDLPTEDLTIEDEPTMEELDKMIAERYATMPGYEDE